MNDISNIKSNTNLFSQQAPKGNKGPKEQQTNESATNNQIKNQDASEELQSSSAINSKNSEITINKEKQTDSEKVVKQNQQSNRNQIKEKLEKIIPEVQELIEKNQRSLEFDVAEEENRVIITVRDKATNQIIRQIPPEEFTSLAEKLLSGERPPNTGYFLDSKI